jgi:hypothetical protein
MVRLPKPARSGKEIVANYYALTYPRHIAIFPRGLLVQAHLAKSTASSNG